MAKLAFFNIGKANAKIEELETQLAALTENQAAIATGAESLQGELATAKAALTAETAKTAEIQAKLSKAETDLAAAVSKQADFDAKVKTAASAKAAEIVSNVGVPPIKQKAGTQGADEKPSMSRKDFEALKPEERNEFFRKGGKLTE